LFRPISFIDCRILVEGVVVEGVQVSYFIGIFRSLGSWQLTEHATSSHK
jgi:hypothetical protein